jgi:serine/threonine protein kinase
MPNLPSCSDYCAAIRSPLSIKDLSLQGGKPIEHNERLVMYTGGFCVVFPYQLSNNKKYAIRCWHVKVDDVKRRTKKISEKLQQLHLPYFVEFTYEDNALLTASGLQPIVKMDWVEADNIKKFIGKNLNNQILIKKLADLFLEMVKVLHQNLISHGDLQHGNILVKNDGSLVLVDYDSMCIPELAGEKEEIKGLPGYQHPARYANSITTPVADYFSELVIYLSILAIIEMPNLWHELNIEDTEELIFSKKDYESKGNSLIFHRLLYCNNSQIKNLTTTLIDYCNKSTILDFKPLEEVIKPPVNIETISGKWISQMPIPPKVPVIQVNIDSISSKW